MNLLHIVDRVRKKANQSNCCYRVGAIGINCKGEVIGSSINRHRFQHKSGGLHAEMLLMKRFPRSIKTIVICRVGRGGDILPINPCSVCSEKAKELNIQILTVQDLI